jgi:hypothetical protein
MDSTTAHQKPSTELARVPRSRLAGADALALVVYAGAALALGFADFRMRRFPLKVVAEYIPGVIDGTYGAPAIYRVLAPYTTHYFSAWTGLDPLVGFLITRLLWIFASLVTIHAFLRVWYSPGASLGGGLAVAALLPLTFTNSWAHPDSFPELCLFTLGCLAVASRRDLLLYPVLALAASNRETAVFLVPLWAFVRWGTLRVPPFLAQLAGYTAVWALVYGGLRWWRGVQHYQYWMLDQNIGVLKILPAAYDPYTRIVAYLGLVFLAIPAWLAVKGARTPGTPPFFMRALPVAALFFVTCVLFSALAESRIFLPLVPLLLPAAVRVFASEE